MKYRKEDDSGDITFGASLNSFEQDNPESVALAVKNRLEMFWKEWFMDTDAGTKMPVGNISKEAADSIVRQRITSTQGVKSIVSFESAIERRRYVCTVTIDTVFGETATRGELVWL